MRSAARGGQVCQPRTERLSCLWRGWRGRRRKAINGRRSGMDLNLKGKVAIVTGAGGGGIGTAVAHELAGEGATVVANDIDRGWADRVAKQVVGMGARSIATYADVASFRDCT